MFPWLAFGHLIPFLELAKHMAQRGHQISFISTPKNIQRLPKIPPHMSPLINFVSLPLPRPENLPRNAEATMDIPTSKIPFLKTAYDNLQDSLHHFLETSCPDWIIYDFAPYWLPPIAAKLGISQVFFSIYNAWSISFVGASSSALINGTDPRTEPEHFTAPPKWVTFPSKVAYKLHEARQFLGQTEANSSGVSDMFRAGSVLAGCDVIALRGCLELEADFLRLVGELHHKPAVPIGLLPPSADQVGGGVDETWVTISEWLEKRNKGSVVYVAFGSELTLSPQEITELALGLEMSGLPFFWALKKLQHDAAGNEVLVELPNGFEERVKRRGLVWTTWAPQLKILGHDSVGGFLTHCGTSSTVEAVYFGRVMIMLPFMLDQGLIARAYGERKVGIEVPRDENDGSFTRNSVADSLRLAMAEKEGEEYRESVKQLRKLLFDDEALHDRYIDHFVQLLQHRRFACKDM